MMKTRQLFAAVALALFAISLAVVLTLNFKPLYYMDMKLMNLAEETGYSEEEIKENYDALIEYNSVFSDGVLEFPTLPMSETGRIHFEEVRNVFVFFEAVLLPVTLLLSILLIWSLKGHKPLYLKWAPWLMIGIPAVLGACIAINWDRVFVLFHEIVFNNDYWIFHPSTDPIILLLPDVFFLHCACMILGLVILASVGCYLKYKGVSMKYAGIAAAVFCVFTLAGCGNDKVENSDLELYAGKYVAMVAEISDYQIEVEEAVGAPMVLKVSADGEAVFKIGNKKQIGSWSVTSSQMLVRLANETYYGKIQENTVVFHDIFGIDAKITFAKKGTDAEDLSYYYPEKEQAVFGTWEVYGVEELVKEGLCANLDELKQRGIVTGEMPVETMGDVFTITFEEDHTARFVFMGEMVEVADWGYGAGDCFMSCGGYNLCAYPVEEDKLTVDIYNGDMWYILHCRMADGIE